MEPALQLVNDSGVKIARRIDVAEQNRIGLAGGQLFRPHISGTKPIATGSHRAHIDGVRYLEVVAQAAREHNPCALEACWKDAWTIGCLNLLRLCHCNLLLHFVWISSNGPGLSSFSLQLAGAVFLVTSGLGQGGGGGGAGAE